MTHTDLLRTLRTLTQIEDDVPYGVTKAAAKEALLEIVILRQTLWSIVEMIEEPPARTKIVQLAQTCLARLES